MSFRSVANIICGMLEAARRQRFGFDAWKWMRFARKHATMTRMRKLAAFTVLAMLVSLPASAQVEKVVADAQGIT